MSVRSDDASAGGWRSSARTVAATVAVVLVGVSACVRAVVGYDSLPRWSSDPFIDWTPSTTLGPAGLMGLDIAALVGLVLALVGVPARSRGEAWTVAGAVGLWGVGAGVVLWHGLRGGGDVEDLVRGVPWVGAVASGIAAWRLSSGSGAGGLSDAGRWRGLGRWRGPVLAGVVVAMVVPMVGHAAWYAAVEHPATVEQFRQGKSAFLEARGWEEGSPTYLQYVRRLEQSDASAWFGISNVLATFMAAGLVLGAGVLVQGISSARRAGERSAAIAGAVLVAVGAAGLMLTGSKGGMASAAVGLVLGGLAWWAGRMGWMARVMPWAMALLPMAVIGAVLVRLAVGEGVDELSLLVRGFYTQGAAGVWLEEPVLGVGPGGFREAYLRHRPGLATEEVDSPHSVLMEWVSTLGVGGIAWAAVLIGLAWACGRGVGVRGDGAMREVEGSTEGGSGELGRGPWRVVWVVVASGMLVSMGMERQLFDVGAQGLTKLGLRLGSMVGWGVLAGALAGVLVRWRAGVAGAGLVGAAAVLVAHGQIELTPTWSNGAAAFMTLLGTMAGLGVGGGRAAGEGAGVGAVGALARVGPVVVSVVMGLVVAVGVWPGVVGRSVRLAEAAEVAGAVAEARELWRQLGEATAGAAGGGGGAGGLAASREASTVAAMLRERLGLMGTADQATIGAALGRAEASARERVAGMLEALVERWPRDLRVRRALVRLVGAGRGAELAEAAVALEPERSGAWSLVASAWTRVGAEAGGGGSGDGAGRRAAVERARAAMERVCELDPNGLEPRWSMWLMCRELGDEAGATRWAMQALEVDERSRLDALARLTEAQRGLLRASVVGGDGVGGGG